MPASRRRGFVERFSARGVGAFLVTAIERDGTLAGPDLRLLADVRAVTHGVLLAAGGFASLEHVAAARDAGCDGAVVGRALYDGSLNLREALTLARASSRAGFKSHVRGWKPLGSPTTDDDLFHLSRASTGSPQVRLSGDPDHPPRLAAPDHQTAGRFETSRCPATFETSSQHRNPQASFAGPPRVQWRNRPAGHWPPRPAEVAGARRSLSMTIDRVIRRRILLGLLIAASFGLLTAWYREVDNGPLHRAQGSVADAAVPLSAAVQRVARPFRDLWEWGRGLANARDEVQRLQRINQQQAVELARQQQQLADNTDYRTLLGFTRNPALLRSPDGLHPARRGRDRPTRRAGRRARADRRRQRRAASPGTTPSSSASTATARRSWASSRA